MSLPSPSIEKLFRELFPGDAPLELADDEREAFAARLQQRFEGDRFVKFERDSWGPPSERARHLRTIRLRDPEDRHSYSDDRFPLRLDESGRLVIGEGQLTAQVSGFDEVVAFILECKRRLERQRVLRKRREKVHAFQEAAMVAQMKKLAREEKVEVMTELTTANVKLWVRLNEERDAIEIRFSPKSFQEVLPRLPGVIRALRESYAAGVTFKTVNRRSLPWNGEWITYRDPDDV